MKVYLAWSWLETANVRLFLAMLNSVPLSRPLLKRISELRYVRVRAATWRVAAAYCSWSARASA